MDKTMILQPRLSEKTYALAQTRPVYVFAVPKSATKQAVASAVAAQFSVTVTDVNITNVKGKQKRTVRKGGRATFGRRSDTKKAYVTLQAGEKLPFFDAEEDDKTKGGKKAGEKTAKKEKN